MLNIDTISTSPSTDAIDIDPKWSDMQADIFRFVAFNNESAIVEAVAGSGKTTTILESMKYIRSSGAVTFLAFNRSIADELRMRVPSGVEASTFHALGNRALSSYKKMKLNKRRVNALIEKTFDEKYKTVFYPARQLIDLARNIGLGLPSMPNFDLPNLYALADEFDIIPRDEKNTDLMLSVARSTLLTMSKTDTKEYDFTDMLYLPLLWNLPFPKVETLYVDEAQDLNSIQHMILQNSLSNNGRVISVGDTHQAIYGFRGADSSSMQTLRDLFNSRPFPLSISYRCPKSVVALAQSLVPHIESAPTAIEGSVTDIYELPDLHTLSVNDMILCRNNAPLINFALKMLSSRLPMRILGDFGDRLVTFVNSFKTDDIHIFSRRLEEWYETEIDKLQYQQKLHKIGAVVDKYTAITYIMKGCNSVDAILRILSKLFEQGNGPIISTIHKAKGMEAEKVFILYPELMPSKYARSASALQQEYNLLYVAYTRAKQDLILIHQEQEEPY